ncbi:MAG: F0F1 ATP synthase subunit B [Spirochaetes bacterium]|nr:F0F1 ATP synthase subunit B [Spirochaetota bacterium]MCK5266821.1 F0F1 ATP synthase subunit B [Spirochaetota bacterium]
MKRNLTKKILGLTVLLVLLFMMSSFVFAEEQDAAPKKKGNMVDVNIYEIFIQLISFFILYIFMKKFLFSKMSDFLKERSKKIQDDIDKAAENKIETEKIIGNQKEMIKEARLDAQSIKENAERTALLEAETILKDAHDKAKDYTENSIKAVEIAKERAKEDLAKQVGVYSVKIAEKILQREVTVKDNDKMMKEFFKEVGEI